MTKHYKTWPNIMKLRQALQDMVIHSSRMVIRNFTFFVTLILLTSWNWMTELECSTLLHKWSSSLDLFLLKRHLMMVFSISHSAKFSCPPSVTALCNMHVFWTYNFHRDKIVLFSNAKLPLFFKRFTATLPQYFRFLPLHCRTFWHFCLSWCHDFSSFLPWQIFAFGDDFWPSFGYDHYFLIR